MVKSSWSHIQLSNLVPRVLSWERGCQLRGLTPVFQRTGTVFWLQQFLHRKFIFLDRQRYSALPFKLNETAFSFGDKYCFYVNLPLNLTVPSWISRIKTIGGGCWLLLQFKCYRTPAGWNTHGTNWGAVLLSRIHQTSFVDNNWSKGVHWLLFI